MEEVVKKKRGRPRKTPEIPEEVKSIIEEVKQKQEELQQQIEETKPETIEHREGEWDVKIDDPVPYFDKRLSPARARGHRANGCLTPRRGGSG